MLEVFYKFINVLLCKIFRENDDRWISVPAVPFLTTAWRSSGITAALLGPILKGLFMEVLVSI